VTATTTQRTTTFRTTSKFFGPPWLVNDGAESTLVQYSLDLMLDAYLERMRLGLLARLPDAAELVTGALELLGRDRRTIRGIGESDTTYAGRLKNWLVDARRRGNPFAMLQKLSEYVGADSSFRTVDARGNWFSRSATGVETYTLDTGNWNWDSSVPSSPQWSRFWVIIYPGTRWTTGTTEWGTGSTWGTPGTSWGSTMNESEVAAVRQIVSEWKPSGTRCVSVILAFDPASFDPAAPEPDGTWGTWYKLSAGVAVPSRLGTARYFEGTL
jgi:hypothetical protein